MAAEDILALSQFCLGKHQHTKVGGSLILDHLRVASIQPNVKICMELDVMPEFLNPFNHIQSGVLITVTDAVTFAATCVLEKFLVNGVSLEMHVSCLKEMVPGQKIYIEAEAMRGGPKFYHCKAEFRDEDGVLVAQSGQVIYLLAKSRSTKEEKDLHPESTVTSKL